MRLWNRYLCVLSVGLLISLASSQSLIQMDYGLYLSDFDLDMVGNGIASGISVSGTWGNLEESVQAAGAQFRLDRVNKFSGIRSQRVDISRSSGAPGTLTLRFDPISEARAILPPEGTPVLVRIAYRSENFRNARYRFRYRTGKRWGVLVNYTSEPTQGWQIISQVVPLQRNSNGSLFLNLYLEIELGEGDAQGRIWIDGVQSLAQFISVPARVRPNSIKVATFGGVLRDWARFLQIPIDFALARHSDILAFQRTVGAPKGLLYLNPYKSFNVSHLQWLDDLYDYYDADRNHPDWFLLDSNGNRIRDLRYPEYDAFFMDIGHPQAQQRVAERLILLTRERSIVPEWIFLDNWSDWNPSQQYPTRTSMMPAWTSLLNRIAPVIKNDLGAKIIVNVGSRVAIFIDGNPGEQWLPLIDGAMQEGAFVIYNTQERRYVYRSYNATRSPVSMTNSSWVSLMRAVTNNPSKYWFLLVQCDPNDREMFRFAVSSYLVIAHERTILSFDARGNPGVDSLQEFMFRPELFLPLGNPTGTYTIEQGSLSTGALFKRDFEHGVVLVNPHPELQFQYRTSRAYKDWDGNVIPANTMLTIGPRRGVVLYAAPEIVLQVSPPQVTALPGETVTFTVQYRNNGLVDATNVKISVPLPEGLEFVSSSTGGQYLNRQVTWTLPLVRAGQSGTLTFQARVQ